MYRTVACNKGPVQHQFMDMMGLCIMLCVFFVAQTITNTTRLSHATKIHCVCSQHVLPNFRHIESVLIAFHTLKIFCCQTQNGYSPVYIASGKGHTEVVDLLVQAGADIHLVTTNKVHVSSTYTVSSTVAAILEANVRLIEFVVYDLHFY